MHLRPNQILPVQKSIDFFNQNKSIPSLIVAPTAFGKSVLIAKITEGIKDKVIILQPSKELLEQNYNKYIALGYQASIYSASFNSKEIGDVTYATIGSIKNIGNQFKDLGFTKLIIDEAHLYPRDSDSMLGNFLKDTNITHCLGLTATPLKLQTNTGADRKPYSVLKMLTSVSKKTGNFFKEFIHVSQIQEMVAMKFWSPIIYKSVPLDQKKLRFNSSKSDFNQDSMDQVFIEQSLDEKIINELKNVSNRKSILIFVPSIAQAEALKTKIIGSEVVHSQISSRERNRIINDFKSLKIRIIINVSVLSVGFDHPELDCIILARPTASLSWYYQALGRITRIHPNKKDGLVIDLSGSVDRFGKIEFLYFEKEKQTWKLFGEGDKLLTGIPIHEIGYHIKGQQYIQQKSFKMPFGKYKDKDIKEVPIGYRKWMLENFTWDQRNNHIKEAILALHSEEIA